MPGVSLTARTSSRVISRSNMTSSSSLPGAAAAAAADVPAPGVGDAGAPPAAAATAEQDGRLSQALTTACTCERALHERWQNGMHAAMGF